MYSQSGTPPLLESSPVLYAAAGRIGVVGDTTLTLAPQARAHSRRNLATAGFSASALQCVANASARAGADETKLPATAPASATNLIPELHCMKCCPLLRRYLNA